MSLGASFGMHSSYAVRGRSMARLLEVSDDVNLMILALLLKFIVGLVCIVCAHCQTD